jgi:PAS domain S-box-containing protein
MKAGMSSHLRGYAAALMLVAAAFLLRLAIDPLLGDRSPFLLFTLAVLIAGGGWGVGPGLFAVVISTLAGTFFFLTPNAAFFPLTLDETTNIAAFLATSVAILAFAHVLSRSRRIEARTAAAARTSETRERRLIDAVQDYAIYELDRNGVILTWNAGAERLKGWSAEEIIGREYQILHTPEQRAAGEPRRELRIAAEEGRFEEEAPRMRKDGSVFAAHVTLFPMRSDDGDIAGFVKVTRDITDLSVSARALLESRQRMEAIVSSAMDAIITVDEEQNIVLFNPAAERMFGCRAEEATGQSIERFIPERFRPGHDQHIKRFRQTGGTNRRMGALGAVSGLRTSGEEFPIEASISQVTVGGRRLFTVILRDITERKLGDEARTLLAREVDHRAKNAMAVAQAVISLTRADTVADFANTVKGRIAALARAHSLLSQSQWRGAPLEQVIRDELTSYAKEGQLHMAGPPATITAEAVQPLSLLFHELATNALKHGALSRAEGSISVSWQGSKERLVITWTERGGPAVQQPERTGFGTKLIAQVAGRQLRADVAHEWRPEGLRVELEMPSELFTIAAAAPDAAASEAGEETRAEKGDPAVRGNLFLLEDEELVAEALAAELRQLGWHIAARAGTLAEAQALLSSANGIDAAVLDVNIRGVPVYPVAEELTRLGVPYVFCTGYESVAPDGRFEAAPVVRKPATGSAVSAALELALKKGAPAAEDGVPAGD